MTSLRNYILYESGAPADMACYVLSALTLIEAVGVNKDYLAAEAKRHNTTLPEVKQKIDTLWKDAGLDTVGNMSQPKALKYAQPLKNLIYLAEIRDSNMIDKSFMDKLCEVSKGEDLTQSMLRLNKNVLSKISSDTTTSELVDIVDKAASLSRPTTGPVDYWSDKLSGTELRRWNNVRPVLEFPDGFKWVVALNKDGSSEVGYMPSSITYKTMSHCGNAQNEEGDIYYELRGPDNRAYITVIVNNGEIQESKAFGNEPLKNRYDDKQLMEKYKAFLKSDLVSGTGRRYDNGTLPAANLGMKDYLGNDVEFIKWAIKHKRELFGSVESRIMMWRDAVENGIVTIEQLKTLFMSGTTMSEFMSTCDSKAREYMKNTKFGNLAMNRTYKGGGRMVGQSRWTNAGDDYTPDA